MNFRDAGKSQRWQPAIAIAAALSLFVALIAGSALRPRFSAAALPEPAAWSHGTPDVGQVQIHAGSQPASQLGRGSLSGSSWAYSQGVSPTNKKPFHSMWMTHDRPPTWARLTRQSVWAPLPMVWSLRPIILAALDLRPGDAHRSASSAALGDHDILTELCVARR